jgi:AraC-like DNA-binding protein
MMPVHCSTLRSWNHAAGRAFGDIAVSSPVARFEASMASRHWDGLDLVAVDSPAAQVRGASHGGHAGWYLIFNDRGPCQVRQAGRSVRLDAGEASLLRADVPWEIGFGQPNRTLVVALPWLQAPGELEAHRAARHGRDESMVLGTLLQRLQRMEPAQAGRLDGVALRRALVDLLVLARPDAGPVPPGAAAAGRQSHWLLRAEAIVRRDLACPALDARAIAGELGLSLRRVQALFERQGTTVSAYVLEQRLQHAAGRLREARGLPITQAALDAGFGDLSYFCRVFKRRFGCSARAWRDGGF